MKTNDIVGTPILDFFRDRFFALFDAVLAAVVLALLIYLAKKASRARFLVNYSLRSRMIVALVFLALLCAIGALLKLNVMVLLVFAFAAFALLVLWVLKDLSSVGITNAFATTKHGVSAGDSLRLVARDLEFLGIGAKKLTDTAEFDAMLSRCAAAGGSLKFLLSSPQNTALEDMARRNGRDDFSYRSRVKESIREIVKRATEAGASFEVRLYDLQQEIALPHFRLMFIDGRLCVFSQLVWSSGEGLDNPQLILRSNKNIAGSSLYKGYHDYFDTLWDLDTTVPVTPELLASWSA